jgi:ABC-type Fe3+ transport system substrate-binding protein
MVNSLYLRELLRATEVAALALLLGLGAAPAAAADQDLIDAAKREGHVTWYTALIVDQFARPTAEVFERKYGIKVDYVRADGAEIMLRVMNEGISGHVHADIFDGIGALPLVKQGLVAHFIPDSARRLPQQYYDPDGTWVATNLYVLTPGFNTNLVPKGTEPRTFQDLLDPKWKGKMAWNGQSSFSAAPGFVGNVLINMGEEKGRSYLQALAKQNITSLHVSARQVLDQVIAGEYAIALQVFNNHAVISAEKGAPSAWIPMEPATAVLSALQLTQNAPHPNAGRLFEDFLVSTEGQRLFRDADYMPVDPDTPPRDPTLRPDGSKLRAIYFTPQQVDAMMPEWVGIYQQYFR